MCTYILTIFLTFLLVESLGYLAHRLAHIPGTILYRAHMVHHLELYGPGSFLSEKYVTSFRNSFVTYLAPIFVVLCLGAWILLNRGHAITFIVTLSVISFINDKIHTHVHLKQSFLSKIPYFGKLQELHVVHHINMRKNYGIMTFFIDKLLNTFSKGKEERVAKELMQ